MDDDVEMNIVSYTPLAEKRARAFAHGAWQCPACPDGYQVYLINTDMNVCAVCGYKGGELKKP